MQPAPDGQARPDRAEGVFLVDHRHTEDSHDRVADEFLRSPAKGEQLLSCHVEETAEDLSSALRIETTSQLGRVDQVGEEHRDHLSLVRCEQRRNGRAAVRAEAGALWEHLSADRARHRFRVEASLGTARTETLTEPSWTITPRTAGPSPGD